MADSQAPHVLSPDVPRRNSRCNSKEKVKKPTFSLLSLSLNTLTREVKKKANTFGRHFGRLYHTWPVVKDLLEGGSQLDIAVNNGERTRDLLEWR